MAFVNLSLLLGGAFVAIPVILHLIMRQRPKQLIFPALRFVHEPGDIHAVFTAVVDFVWDSQRVLEILRQRMREVFRNGAAGDIRNE